MLAKKGRIQLQQSVHAFAQALFVRPNVMLAEITSAIAVEAGELPHLHGDPADRILVATALELDVPLLTADELLLDYVTMKDKFRAIDARR